MYHTKKKKKKNKMPAYRMGGKVYEDGGRALLKALKKKYGEAAMGMMIPDEEEK
tara:strand:+ start:3673 stop:3834 length:162 start_codon:yes stop_codon:yes gene_type:complete